MPTNRWSAHFAPYCGHAAALENVRTADEVKRFTAAAEVHHACPGTRSCSRMHGPQSATHRAAIP
eukprot:780850-Pyramimonas_sp.AAC.1